LPRRPRSAAGGEDLAYTYLKLIGLEAEAASSLQWQADLISGLFQTEDYASQLSADYRLWFLPLLLAFLTGSCGSGCFAKSG
jgi:hypothetical protein